MIAERSLPFLLNRMNADQYPEAPVVRVNELVHDDVSDQYHEEVDRVLRPGGLLFVGHEPNRRFRETFSLRALFQVLRTVLLPRETIDLFLRRARLYGVLYRLKRTFRGNRGSSLVEIVNHRISGEQLFHRPFRPSKMPAITDIRDDEGFYPDSLLPTYELLELQTYNHLLTVDLHYGSKGWVQRLSRRIGIRLPERGGTFFAVYRKSDSMSQPHDGRRK
jgi:hypothetical protein